MNVDQVFAEEAVLCGLLMDNMRLHDVANIIRAEHFTSADRIAVFSEIRSRVLAGDPADVVTICEANGKIADYVMELAASAYSSANIMAYADIVHKNWKMREAVGIAMRLTAGARSKEDDSVDRAIAELLALNSSAADCEFTGKQALKLAWQEIERASQREGQIPGIPTGIDDLDEILGGFHDSDLTIVGARPAMGKTAFLGGLVEAAAIAGKKPGLISAEQPAIQMALRRVSALSGVSAMSLRNGSIHEEDWAKLQAGMSAGIARDMMVYDRSAITLDELIGVARKWVHSHGVKSLYIDYAQRITVPGVDRTTEVALVARGLKNLARDLKIPVIALAQVVKTVDQRTDKRPTAGDLANSDELTREADQIIMLYRGEVYNPNTQDKGIAELLIEKNRHGPTGFKRVKYIGETMTFQSFR